MLNRRWLSTVAGVAAAAALAGTAFANEPVTLHATIIRTVTPVTTAPLRDLQYVNLPSIMRRIIGDQHFSQHQINQLYEELVNAGYLRPAEKSTILNRTIKPAMSEAPQVHDSVVQSKLFLPQPNSITAGVSFAGIGISGGDSIGCAPPDTDMAVGDDYVVEIVNLCSGAGAGAFKVWDKSGNVVQSTTSLAGLWTSGSGCDMGNGDNVVLYDQLAHRWILSQFNNAITGECVAVSTTSDPTGSYYLYNFVIDPTGFTDYPKIGKWIVGDPRHDAYFVTDNDFTNNDVYVNFTALERDQMLLGNAAQEIVINGPSTNGGGLDYSALPADLDGSTLPPSNVPGLFANYVSPYLFGGSTPYALATWAMNVNWSTPSATLYGPRLVAVAPFNDGICNQSRACIPQPGGSNLDALGDRLMFRLAYRHFASIHRQILVVNQAVGTGGAPSSPPAGIRWYQLIASDAGPGSWTVWQQGTYLPNDGNSRWMGSIAMDKKGNAGMAFSMSSASLDPSVAFTGQNVAAARARSNVMDAGETMMVTGGGVQSGTGNRWGDYSSIMTDPADDCTFWAADEYISATGSFHWSTYLGSFKFNNCN